MLTNRFIALPIRVSDKKDENLTGKAEWYDTYLRVNPFEICSYRPTDDRDGITDPADFIYTSITLKNGEGYIIYLSIDEFEKRLNALI